MEMVLSDKAFWDTDVRQLDKHLHKNFIIARVFQYGNINDFRIIIKTYSKAEIKEALLNCRGLDTITKDFATTLNFI